MGSANVKMAGGGGGVNSGGNVVAANVAEKRRKFSFGERRKSLGGGSATSTPSNQATNAAATAAMETWMGGEEKRTMDELAEAVACSDGFGGWKKTKPAGGGGGNEMEIFQRQNFNNNNANKEMVVRWKMAVEGDVRTVSRKLWGNDESSSSSSRQVWDCFSNCVSSYSATAAAAPITSTSSSCSTATVVGTPSTGNARGYYSQTNNNSCSSPPRGSDANEEENGDIKSSNHPMTSNSNNNSSGGFDKGKLRVVLRTNSNSSNHVQSNNSTPVTPRMEDLDDLGRRERRILKGFHGIVMHADTPVRMCQTMNYHFDGSRSIVERIERDKESPGPSMSSPLTPSSPVVFDRIGGQTSPASNQRQQHHHNSNNSNNNADEENDYQISCGFYIHPLASSPPSHSHAAISASSCLVIVAFRFQIGAVLPSVLHSMEESVCSSFFVEKFSPLLSSLSAFLSSRAFSPTSIATPLLSSPRTFLRYYQSRTSATRRASSNNSPISRSPPPMSHSSSPPLLGAHLDMNMIGKNPDDGMFVFDKIDVISKVASPTQKKPGATTSGASRSIATAATTTAPSTSSLTNVQLLDNFGDVDSNNNNNNNNPANVPGSGRVRVGEQGFKWKRGKLIGAGAMGKVYIGEDEETGAMMAVKQVTFVPGGENEEEIRALEREISMFRSLKHPNIVRYYGVEWADTKVSIFLEYVSGGSLQSLIRKNNGPLAENIIKSFTKQILSGLKYLHEQEICHRDIKTANILCSKYGNIKLADFGASKHLSNASCGLRSLVGTPYMMAPEVVKQSGHGMGADIWSLGCCVFEMAVSTPPWSDCKDRMAAMYRIATATAPPPLPENVEASKELRDFINICMTIDMKKRPPAHLLEKHEFLVGSNGADFHPPPALPLTSSLFSNPNSSSNSVVLSASNSPRRPPSSLLPPPPASSSSPPPAQIPSSSPRKPLKSTDGALRHTTDLERGLNSSPKGNLDNNNNSNNSNAAIAPTHSVTSSSRNLVLKGNGGSGAFVAGRLSNSNSSGNSVGNINSNNSPENNNQQSSTLRFPGMGISNDQPLLLRRRHPSQNAAPLPPAVAALSGSTAGYLSPASPAVIISSPLSSPLVLTQSPPTGEKAKNAVGRFYGDESSAAVLDDDEEEEEVEDERKRRSNHPLSKMGSSGGGGGGGGSFSSKLPLARLLGSGNNSASGGGGGGVSGILRVLGRDRTVQNTSSSNNRKKRGGDDDDDDDDEDGSSYSSNSSVLKSDDEEEEGRGNEDHGGGGDNRIDGKQSRRRGNAEDDDEEDSDDDEDDDEDDDSAEDDDDDDDDNEDADDDEEQERRRKKEEERRLKMNSDTYFNIGVAQLNHQKREPRHHSILRKAKERLVGRSSTGNSSAAYAKTASGVSGGGGGVLSGMFGGRGSSGSIIGSNNNNRNSAKIGGGIPSSNNNNSSSFLPSHFAMSPLSSSSPGGVPLSSSPPSRSLVAAATTPSPSSMPSISSSSPPAGAPGTLLPDRAKGIIGHGILGRTNSFTSSLNNNNNSGSLFPQFIGKPAGGNQTSPRTARTGRGGAMAQQHHHHNNNNNNNSNNSNSRTTTHFISSSSSSDDDDNDEDELDEREGFFVDKSSPHSTKRR